MNQKKRKEKEKILIKMNKKREKTIKKEDSNKN